MKITRRDVPITHIIKKKSLNDTFSLCLLLSEAGGILSRSFSPRTNGRACVFYRHAYVRSRTRKPSERSITLSLLNNNTMRKTVCMCIRFTCIPPSRFSRVLYPLRSLSPSCRVLSSLSPSFARPASQFASTLQRAAYKVAAVVRSSLFIHRDPVNGGVEGHIVSVRQCVAPSVLDFFLVSAGSSFTRETFVLTDERYLPSNDFRSYESEHTIHIPTALSQERNTDFPHRRRSRSLVATSPRHAASPSFPFSIPEDNSDSDNWLSGKRMGTPPFAISIAILKLIRVDTCALLFPRISPTLRA